MSKKIGFIGLGTMGFPMAVNLKKAGFEVIGYDAFKGAYEKAGAAGITMVQTPKEVAAQAEGHHFHGARLSPERGPHLWRQRAPGRARQGQDHRRHEHPRP